MVNMVQKQQISNKIIIPNNICLSNFALESLPGGVLDHALLLDIAGVGYHPDGHGGPETRNFKHDYHPKQLLFNQLCPDISPWECP